MLVQFRAEWHSFLGGKRNFGGIGGLWPLFEDL